MKPIRLIRRLLAASRGKQLLPHACLRGLRKKDWVVEDAVSTLAFTSEVVERKDGGREVSVNWEDDAGVEARTLSQPNAQHGAARVTVSRIEQINEGTAPPWLGCERAALEDNPHHGNIVYGKSVTKHVEKMIAATLALHSQLIRPLRPG
jgi:hypothetical protein